VSDERDGSDKKAEDLFEDLDKFFAPIEDVDWPEPTPQPVRPAVPTPGDHADEAAPGEGEEDEEEQEILPQGWAADIDDFAQPPGASPAPPGPAPWERAEAEEAEEAAPEESEPAPSGVTAEPDRVEEPTAQLSAEEWDRLRAAVEFGEEEEEEPVFAEEPALPEVPAASAGGRGMGEGEEEEPEGVTLEDLRAVPPVYRDLPGPEEAEPAGVEAGPFAAGEETEAEAEEPSFEAVEAAAAHFAESMRETPEEVEEELLIDLDRETATPRTVRVGPADQAVSPPREPERRPDVRVDATDAMAAGPSWQEPSSEEVTPGPEAPAGGRNIPAAFLSAVVLAGLAVGSIAIGRAPFAVVASIVVLLAQGELYAAMRKARYQPATAVGLLFGAFVLAAAYREGEAAMLAMVAASAIFSFLWYMAVPARLRRNTLANVSLTVLGVVYVAFLAGYVLMVVSIPTEGRVLTLAILGLAFLYDIAAFFVGYLWGSRALAPTISPRKSWEGVIGATFIVLIVGLIALPNIDVIGTVGRAIGLAVTVAIFAPLGDLAESLIKRDLGVKDMGTLLPGHGGALDRIDSVLFVAPAAFYYFRLVF
jgi:phosphatidate cytidylyltransferase